MFAHHLKVMGLPSTCHDPKVIKAAYKRLALQHHPDKGGDPVMFREIKATYDSLMRVFHPKHDDNMHDENARRKRERDEERSEELKKRDEERARELKKREEELKKREEELRIRTEVLRLLEEQTNADRRLNEARDLETHANEEEQFFVVMEDGQLRKCFYPHRFMKCGDVKISIGIRDTNRCIVVRFKGATHVVSDEIPPTPPMPTNGVKANTKYPKSHPWLKEVRASSWGEPNEPRLLDIIINGNHPPIVAFREHLDSVIRTRHLATLEASVGMYESRAKIEKATARGVRALIADRGVGYDRNLEKRAQDLEWRAVNAAYQAGKCRSHLRMLQAAPPGLWMTNAMANLLYKEDPRRAEAPSTDPPPPYQVSPEAEIELAKIELAKIELA